MGRSGFSRAFARRPEKGQPLVGLGGPIHEYFSGSHGTTSSSPGITNPVISCMLHPVGSVDRLFTVASAEGAAILQVEKCADDTPITPELGPPPAADTFFDYLVVLDFEATCDDGPHPPVPQEIVEFPSVLLETSSWSVVAEFEAFVRPTFHPTLTRFCKELTSIRQSQVDAALTFVDVFREHQRWLVSHGLPLEPSEDGLAWAFVTCGDWDLATMLPNQLRCLELRDCPSCYTRWINIKFPFRAVVPPPVRNAGMAGMLSRLGLELRGTHHRGIDDCRNICAIVVELVKWGMTYRETRGLAASRFPRITVLLRRNAGADVEEHEVVLRKRTLGSRMGVAAGAFKYKMRTAVLVRTGAELSCDDDVRLLLHGDEIVLQT